MPRYGSSDIPHAASTDHRIPRHSKVAPAKPARPARGDVLPIVAFYPGGKGVPAEEVERDRAVALVKLALSGDGSAQRVLGQILPTLEAAMQRDPEDFEAAEKHGYALALQSRWADALAAFEEVNRKAPHQELSVVGAATTAEELKQTDVAVTNWQKAIAINPWEPGYRRHLVQLLVKKEAWEAALPESQAWVNHDPLNPEARLARVQSLLGVQKKEEARAEFARLEALAPSNLQELQIRFSRKLR
jgi:tetratricopeptide (TPR) repeat protein